MQPLGALPLLLSVLWEVRTKIFVHIFVHSFTSIPIVSSPSRNFLTFVSPYMDAMIIIPHTEAVIVIPCTDKFKSCREKVIKSDEAVVSFLMLTLQATSALDI